MSTLLCIIARGDFSYSFLKWRVIFKLSLGQPRPGVGECGKKYKFSKCVYLCVCMCVGGGGGSLINAVGVKSLKNTTWHQ